MFVVCTPEAVFSHCVNLDNTFPYSLVHRRLVQEGLKLKSQTQGLTQKHALVQPIPKIRNISETIEIPTHKPLNIHVYNIQSNEIQENMY